MSSFAKYFITRELNNIGQSEVISESATKSLYEQGVLKKRKKALNSLLDHFKKKYVKHFYEKFPKAQYEDIEEALRDSFEKMIESKPNSKSAEKVFKKTMEDSLSKLSKKKRSFNKNLSCVKVVKSMGIESSMSSLMKRAERILTSQEKKVIEMCCQGKSVRTIGSELGISSATAWRVLNDGLDKIRLSHGMKSRKLG